MTKCSICSNEIKGYGNNSEPVIEGVCCDKCNFETIIPARLKKIKLFKLK